MVCLQVAPDVGSWHAIPRIGNNAIPIMMGIILVADKKRTHQFLLKDSGFIIPAPTIGSKEFDANKKALERLAKGCQEFVRDSPVGDVCVVGIYSERSRHDFSSGDEMLEILQKKPNFA